MKPFFYSILITTQIYYNIKLGIFLLFLLFLFCNNSAGAELLQPMKKKNRYGGQNSTKNFYILASQFFI